MIGFKYLTYFFSIFILFSELRAEEFVGKYSLAQSITPSEYKKWDISIFSDGKNLPIGSGNYENGKKIYAQKCAFCHGEDGNGGIKLDPYRSAIATLVGGKKDHQSLKSNNPKKNIGSYWQYATGLFDYMRRTMPYQNPKSLTTNELYSLSAYLLAENKIISKTLILNQNNLATISMPNVDGFICDNHVDSLGSLCMKNCLLPSEKSFKDTIIFDSKDYLKSDCLLIK